MLLTPEERKAIEARVEAAEKRTSGEIVVALVPSSGGYAWVIWACAATGMGIATFVIALLSLTRWPFSGLQLLEWQIVGTCLGLIASLFPGVRRLWVSQKTRAAKVHRQSLAAFTAAGIAGTRERTGILVYISEFEHRVEILGDKGIHEKVGAGFWDAQVKHIIAGIRSKHAARAIQEAVDQMAEKLTQHFPVRADDHNELPNRILGEEEKT